MMINVLSGIILSLIALLFWMLLIGGHRDD